jgi:sulfate transport system permease protein
VTAAGGVFAEAFRKGAGAYFASFNDPAVLAAIKLTLLAAVIAVPVNLCSGSRRRGPSPSSSFPARAF